MSTSLVTGGAGFIGSHIVRALLSRGDRVGVFDNFSTGKAENLAGLDGRIQVQEGDLRDPAALRQAVKGVDFIFHHAALISVPLSVEDPQICFEINEQGTLNLLEAARTGGVQQVVLASSAAVYGDSDELPLKEDTALRPQSPYAASKRMNEIYAQLYTRVYNLPVTALRYFNVYGLRQAPDSAYAAAIPIFTRRLLRGQPPTVFGDGKQGRDFINVEDVVRANLLAAGAPQAAGEILNICTGVEITLLELLSVLAEQIPGAPAPVFSPPRPGDIYRSIGNPTRAAQVLGFRAQVTLGDGLSQILDWMKT